MKTRDLLHRNFFQSRDPSDWSKYKESRDTIKEIQEHYIKEIQKKQSGIILFFKFNKTRAILVHSGK